MRTGAWSGCAAGIGLLVAVVLRLPGLDATTISLVSDLSQLLAACAASAGCAVAARRTADDRARSWRWLSVGTGCWAAGQAVWSWYELVLGEAVPFPSLADVGFLLFPVAATVGLVTWLGSQGHQLAARGRDVLDGTIVAASLLVLSWVTALGSVVRGGGDSWGPMALSLAYPVGDLIVATLVLMALARGRRGERSTLLTLALGVGGIAVSDSAYVYLVGVGAYSSADVVSSGWVIGFLLVAAAAWSSDRSPVRAAHAPAASPSGRGDQATWLRLVLPYLPLVAAGGVLVGTALRASTTSTVSVLLGVSLVGLVLGRQFLDVLDNRRLLRALSATRDELHHRASHDGLTGLVNRTVFGQRLHAALSDPAGEVSVLFCDLDDFKQVNDRHGHHVGDQLLVVVAQRLRQCVRETDTVARLGGDEFAILVASDVAADVAARVVDLLARPVEIDGRRLTISASVGIAHHPGVSDAGQEALAAAILRQADHAMYAAKQAGKGRTVQADLVSVAS